MLKDNKTEFYVFGEFWLDAGNRLLQRGEQQIGLSLREFEVLFFFVENAGRVIEKSELHEAIWKTTFVEEGTLTQNISRLRKKLEAAGDQEKIIETLPKRGYRFLPSVTFHQIAVPTATAPLHRSLEENAAQRSSTDSSNNTHIENVEVILPTKPLVTFAAPEKQKTKNKKQKLFWLGIALGITVFTAVLFFLRTAAPVPPKSLVAASVVPFTGAAGREDTPAFSSDGKQIVYAWDNDEGSQTDIYVRLTAGGQSVRLTNTPVNEHYPVFSPDGSMVAFVRDFKTYGEVILMPAFGGTERRICRLFSGNYSISYAPDGKTIAVIDTESSTNDKQYAVYLINLETGTRRRLTAPAEFLGETTPRFAPDGKTIAFIRVFDEKRQDLFVVPVDVEEKTLSKEPRQITFDQQTIHSLAWSADGKMIFFVSFRGSNRAGLWRVPAGGGEPETVLTGGREITNLAVSSDGKTIAFVENAPHNFDIWQTESAGNEQKSKKFLASTFNESHPAFAPDDSSILFTSNRSGKNELWAVDRLGNNLRQLTKTEIAVARAAVSPDGKQAAFEGSSNFAIGIFTIEIETGAIRELAAANGSFNFLPRWSTDGKSIYFTSNRTGTDQIWKIGADGAGEPVQITKQGGYQAFPAPDGTLFYSKSKKDVDFWQIPAREGEEERPVPEIAALQNVFGWAANRTGIYFFVNENEDIYNVKIFDFANHKVISMPGKIHLPMRILDSSAVSADGKQILSVTDNVDASSIILATLEQ